MGVFEEVFTKRGEAEEAAERPSAGAFEEVFVRRGRWRKSPTSSDPSGDDVVHLAEHVAADLDLELPGIGEHVPSLLDVHSKPILSEDNSSFPAVTEVVQCVVKNTFLTTEGLNYDSLKDFLQERKIQSCPATSFVIDDLTTKDNMDASADSPPKECIFKTASSIGESGGDSGGSAPRGCSINTVSTFMDIDVYGRLHSIDEMPPHFVPDSAGMFMDGVQHEACNDQNVDDRLASLRMKGSAIQQEISQVSCRAPDVHLGHWGPDVVVCAAFGQHWLPGGESNMQQASAVSPTERNVDAKNDADSTLPSPPEFEGVPPPPVGPAPVPAAIIRLAEAIAPPELGSKELPSIGSMLHHKGECKPCTFFHTRGCENKEDCQFCHLCGPGEKKKRLKHAKRAQREATMAALENAKATLANWAAAEAEGCENCDMVIE